MLVPEQEALEIIEEDLELMVEAVRKQYSITTFLGVVHTANMIRGALGLDGSEETRI